MFWHLFRNAEQASPVLNGRLKCLLSLCFGVCSGMLSGPALSWMEGLSACCHCFGVCSGMLSGPALSWMEGLRGDWPVKFWSQNVPEQVFVFFQVWVPKHAYFSSKSVFLWYMFDFYANENILWTLVCLFLSCGRSFHWKNTPFHPLVTGTFYPKLSTCCLSKCSVASDLQNDVMTQWELPLMKAQRVWKGGKGIPTETS